MDPKATNGSSLRNNGGSTAPSLPTKSSSSGNNGNAHADLAKGPIMAPQNKAAPMRRIPGGIQINTVKRVVAPPRSSPVPSSSSQAAPAVRINGLSEEKRQRVEELRREKERKRREEEERARPVRVKAPSTPQKKVKRRKVVSDDDNDSDDLFSAGSETSSKRKRREKSLSQSNTIGQGYKKLGRAGVLSFYMVPRDLTNTTAFQANPDLPSEQGIFSSSLVHGKVYGAFFSNVSDDQARVTLEYPAPHASEEFSLLVPRDRDEYDPISDLLRTVRCIVEFYLTSEERELFGSLDDLEIGSAAGHLLQALNKGAASLPASREASVLRNESSNTPNGVKADSPIITADKVEEGLASATSRSLLDSPKISLSAPLSPSRSLVSHSLVTTASSSPNRTENSNNGSINLDTDSILRSFTKARNRRDGQLFIRTVDRFNAALKPLKESGKIEENISRMGEKGVAEGIWRCIQEQCYARTVAPRVEELARYEAFSDNVYGELLPRFMSEIAQLTGLNSQSVFVDLGSGVGNLLIQVALQTGSHAFGCEMMKAPSELATLQVEEAKRRWKMWGLSGGEAQAWQGDFGEDIRVRDVLKQADVVLVNNYAFTAPTNDKLSLQFLDLKDGAQIVSLKPFVPPDFRLTERTLSSPLAILRVAQRTYTSGCVSWADGGGKYYIHTVDRSMITQFLQTREAGNGEKGADVRKKQWKAAVDAVEEES